MKCLLFWMKLRKKKGKELKDKLWDLTPFLFSFFMSTKKQKHCFGTEQKSRLKLPFFYLLLKRLKKRKRELQKKKKKKRNRLYCSHVRKKVKNKQSWDGKETLPSRQKKSKKYSLSTPKSPPPPTNRSLVHSQRTDARVWEFWSKRRFGELCCKDNRFGQ